MRPVFWYVDLACFTFCLFLVILLSVVSCGLLLWHSLDFSFKSFLINKKLSHQLYSSSLLNAIFVALYMFL